MDRDDIIRTIAQHIDAVARTVQQSRAAKGERGIWQRRYWEHTVRDPDDRAPADDDVGGFGEVDGEPE